MTTPLHLLAYALSSRYYSGEILAIPSRVAPYRDLEVATGYKRALSRLFSDPDVASNVKRDFVNFVLGKNAEPDAINDQSRMDSIGWWYLHGESYMYLQPLAIKIVTRYKKGPEKLWNVLPETSNLDMTVQDISRIALLDVKEDKDEDVAVSGASGTGLDSNDKENDKDKDETIDPSYFDDPFDP